MIVTLWRVFFNALEKILDTIQGWPISHKKKQNWNCIELKIFFYVFRIRKLKISPHKSTGLLFAEKQLKQRTTFAGCLVF
jgi:hypothetical protein